jgi:hypothetical protein
MRGITKILDLKFMNISETNQKFTHSFKVVSTFLILQLIMTTNVQAIKLTLNGEPSTPNNEELNLTENIIYSYNDIFKPVVTNTDQPFLCIGPNLAGTPTANVSLGMSSSDPFRIYGLVEVISASYDHGPISLAEKTFNIQTNTNSQCVVKGFEKVENPGPGSTLIFADSFDDTVGVPQPSSDISITLLENNSVNVLPQNLILSNEQDLIYHYEVKNIGNQPITFDIVDYFSQSNNYTLWDCEPSIGADVATICGNDVNNPDFNPGTADTYNGAVYLKNAHIETTGDSIIITVTRNPIITSDNTEVDILASALSTNTVDGFKLNNSDTRVFIGNTNTAPQISSVNNQVIIEDEVSGTGSLVFTVSDVETAASSLVVTATSSDQNIVSDANIILGGSGGSRTVSVVANANANTIFSGAVTITLSVNDGSATTTSNFDIDITPVNDRPTFAVTTIGDFPAGTSGNQFIASFIQSIVYGPTSDEDSQSIINRTISNVSDPNGVLSSGMFLATDLVIPLSGQGGTVTFDVIIQDDGGNLNGGLDESDPVPVSFSVLNTPPVISSVNDDTINEDENNYSIGFTISDAETPSTSLIMTALSSDPAIIPLSGIQFTGTGGSRNVLITPAINQNTFISGPVTITLIVDDGSNTSQTTFDMDILPINDAPTFSLDADIVNTVAQAGSLISVLDYATALSMGPTPDEDLTQNVLNYNIQVTDVMGIFDQGVVAVDINNNGTLNYVLTGNTGTATIQVSLQDDGTTNSGGVDTSATQSFTITVQ